MLEAVGPGYGPPRIERQPGTERALRAAPAAAVGAYEIPDSPPADLLLELDRAAGVIKDLAARDVNLHFEANAGTGKVKVQMLDGDGNVLREIPATRLLDVLASGSASGLAVNTVG